MAHETDSLDAFLKHRTSDRAGSFLRGWKKDGTVTVFLHTKCFPISLWVHSFPRIHIQDAKGGGDPEKHVYFGEYNCWEDENTLKRQHKREKDGLRSFPPQKCPMCRLIETVRDMVDEGQLPWLAPVFKFTSDFDDEQQTIHAGGLYGHFGRKDLNVQEKSEMSAARISPQTAWGENMYAKAKYVFYIVNADKPEDGVQCAIETGLLGDKVKDVINDACESAPEPEQGNPFLHPYAIKWEYDDDKRTPFDKKYKARRIERIKPTEKILELIKGDKPDTTRATMPFDGPKMRLLMERHCVVKGINWDRIFAGVEMKGNADHPDMSDVGEFPPKEEQERESAAARPASATKPAMTQPVGEDVECDSCSKPMNEHAPVCPHCGHVYAQAAAAPPPPPKLRKRGEKKAEAT